MRFILQTATIRFNDISNIESYCLGSLSAILTYVKRKITLQITSISSGIDSRLFHIVLARVYSSQVPSSDVQEGCGCGEDRGGGGGGEDRTNKPHNVVFLPIFKPARKQLSKTGKTEAWLGVLQCRYRDSPK